MQIGFEAKRLFTNFTGLGNYARFVVNALSTFAPDNIYFLYSPILRAHVEIDPILTRANVNAVAPEGVYRYIKPVWRSWGLNKDTSVKKLNIFHGLSQELPFGLPGHIRKVVTVHDLIFLRYREFYNPVDVAIYKAKVNLACKSADKVIAISLQTADDLVNYLKVDRDRIEVIYQGCHPVFSQNFSAEKKSAVARKYNLPEQFILHVGTIEKRKNLSLIIKALPMVSAGKGIPLVVVGRNTAYKKEVMELARQLNVADQIIFIHDASFQDLPAIYQQAMLFIYPSLFEGFGIPLVEAIESGVPVITSTGSCFREAAGPAAMYVDPTIPEEMAMNIDKVLLNEDLRKTMIRQSSDYIKQFQPEVIARNLNSLYKRIV